MIQTSIVEAMVMLKKSWDDVSEKTTQNCFCKIVSKSHESAMNEDNDPFEEMLNDDGDNDDALGELKFNLNQPDEVSPDLTLGDLYADELIDFYAEVATNQSRPLSVKRLFLNFLNNLYSQLLTERMKMKMKNPTNKLHIPQEMKLTRQSKL